MVQSNKPQNEDTTKETPDEAFQEDTEVSAGLAGSLDAIMQIANEGGERDTGTNAPEWDGKPQSGTQADSTGSPGSSSDDNREIVSLLGMLKADIEGLRRENETFKEQLLRAAPVTKSQTASPAGDGDDVHALFTLLKSDIENLRAENDHIRSQAFAMHAGPSVIPTPEQDLYGMLAQLKTDIVSLRVENDALRNEHAIGVPHSDEVNRLFAELKSDISGLKHENEALRLENLTARDGVRLGLDEAAYRGESRSAGSWLPTLGALILAVAAGGGGYYFAKYQTGPATQTQVAMPAGGQQEQDLASGLALPKQNSVPKSAEQPSATVAAPSSMPPTADQNVPPKVKKNTTFTRPAAKAAVQSATVKPARGADKSVETAMLSRANDLILSHDLGAARMVLVYLARKGSAQATRRLAQTYDPDYLEKQGLNMLDKGDAARAKRLYGAAVRMGDKDAQLRLEELQ